MLIDLILPINYIYSEEIDQHLEKALSPIEVTEEVIEKNRIGIFFRLTNYRFYIILKEKNSMKNNFKTDIIWNSIMMTQ